MYINSIEIFGLQVADCDIILFTTSEMSEFANSLCYVIVRLQFQFCCCCCCCPSPSRDGLMAEDH